MSELIESIQKIKDNGQFDNYINYIVFPYYKNLVSNTKINFDFPFTALVGKNGCGKSSTLYALYGAPKGCSTGTYWFSTETDPIAETTSSEYRNRYFYGYTVSKTTGIKQVLKQRAKRGGTTTKKQDPDYWETSDPVLSIGMERGIRNEPVTKNVIYLDFRGEISAFDKYFYFGEPKDEKKQDYLRRKSKYLNRAFNNIPVKYPGPNSQIILNKRTELTEQEIAQINLILGKDYKSVILIEHKIYDKPGTSVLLKSNFEFSYTEANAGSGEIAVIQLVHKVMTADNYSLILLDEPEVSLHPGAQRRMQEFLLRQIIKNKHQIVISTHSPSLIEELPSSAIKLFSVADEGKFQIKENIYYQEAFYDLEEKVKNKIAIICEDISARILIEQVLKLIGKDMYFHVEIFRGGAESILKSSVPIYAINNESKNNIYILLDGDKHCDSINTDELLSNILTNEKELANLNKNVYSGIDIPVYIDGGKNGSRKDQKCEHYILYLKFQKENVRYLPNKKIPEEIVLTSKYVKSRYTSILNKYLNITANNARDILMEIKNARLEDNIEYTFRSLTTELILEYEENKKNDDISKLINVLQDMYKFDKKALSATC